MSMSDAPVETPVDVVEEAPPAEDAAAPEEEEVKLYVGNLSYSTTEEKLREEFSKHGTITDIFLPTERGSGRPRGFGFVTMSTRASAEEAIKTLDQFELDGRPIKVNEPRPRGQDGPPRNAGGRGGGGGGGGNLTEGSNVKLYVGNLSFDTAEESVRQLFEQYGTVSDCFLPTDRDTGKMRGFGFVTMDGKDAETAITEVNGTELDGRTLRVNEARGRGGGFGGGGYGGGRGGGKRY